MSHIHHNDMTNIYSSQVFYTVKKFIINNRNILKLIKTTVITTMRQKHMFSLQKLSFTVQYIYIILLWNFYCNDSTCLSLCVGGGWCVCVYYQHKQCSDEHNNSEYNCNLQKYMCTCGRFRKMITVSCKIYEPSERFSSKI